MLYEVITRLPLEQIGTATRIRRRQLPDSAVSAERQHRFGTLRSIEGQIALQVELARITSYNVCYTKLLRAG